MMIMLQAVWPHHSLVSEKMAYFRFCEFIYIFNMVFLQHFYFKYFRLTKSVILWLMQHTKTSGWLQQRYGKRNTGEIIYSSDLCHMLVLVHWVSLDVNASSFFLLFILLCRQTLRYTKMSLHVCPMILYTRGTLPQNICFKFFFSGHFVPISKERNIFYM